MISFQRLLLVTAPLAARAASWSFQVAGQLQASDGRSQDSAGSSVAISGNGLVLAVGAPQVRVHLLSVLTEGVTGAHPVLQHAVGMNTSQGAGYIWTSNQQGFPGSWSQQAVIYPNEPDNSSVSYCGTSVALNFDGSVAMLGCVGYG